MCAQRSFFFWRGLAAATSLKSDFNCWNGVTLTGFSFLLQMRPLAREIFDRLCAAHPANAELYGEKATVLVGVVFNCSLKCWKPSC